jgi:lipopolysaccharide/colanic/teichoic acid biosynthesis glycosyltransferase
MKDCGGASVIRLIDLSLALAGLVFGAPVFLFIYLCGQADTGSPLYFQVRVGRHKKPFTLVKFRTMKVGTESVATHLAPAAAITRFGAVLRKTKLDELPQLWNVLLGDMSLVGPRPNLFSQSELKKARDNRCVYDARPGITGLAQINRVDMSTPEILADIDALMIEQRCVQTYFKIILLTVIGRGGGDRIRANH